MWGEVKLVFIVAIKKASCFVLVLWERTQTGQSPTYHCGSNRGGKNWAEEKKAWRFRNFSKFFFFFDESKFCLPDYREGEELNKLTSNACGQWCIWAQIDVQTKEWGRISKAKDHYLAEDQLSSIDLSRRAWSLDRIKILFKLPRIKECQYSDNTLSTLK